jgi:flagellar biosynthetic protein FliP
MRYAGVLGRGCLLVLLAGTMLSGRLVEAASPRTEADQFVAEPERQSPLSPVPLVPLVADGTAAVEPPSTKPSTKEDQSLAESALADQALADLPSWFDRRWADRLLPAALTFGVMSLAPAVLLMTTCFVRMSVVLSLTRQALGTTNLPSTQILTSLALFLSALVMWPIWTAAYRAGVEPYQAGTLSFQEAYEQGSLPVRRWMAAQIEEADNRETIAMFLRRHPHGPQQVSSYDDIPLEVLLPAFLVSELEVAFMIGFRILLPFLVLDCVVATLVVSTGLVMLPPTLVSLPLKLLVFVMADGWSLVVRGLLDGVRFVASP